MEIRNNKNKIKLAIINDYLYYKSKYKHDFIT